MLPAAHRLRRSVDFGRTVRNGVRAGRSTMVVHYYQDSESLAPSMVGFVVSKAVGNAVTRNRVKRQLRGVIAEHIQQIPLGSHVVVRALPVAADAPYARLRSDLGKSLGKVVRGSLTPTSSGSTQ